MLTALVGAGTVLGSKLLANIVLGGAAAAASAVTLLVGGIWPLLVLQRVVCAMGMLIGFASVAPAVDASRPNFSWTSPSEIIKRGLPVMVGSFGGALASFGLGFLSVTAAGALGPRLERVTPEGGAVTRNPHGGPSPAPPTGGLYLTKRPLWDTS